MGWITSVSVLMFTDTWVSVMGAKSIRLYTQLRMMKLTTRFQLLLGWPTRLYLRCANQHIPSAAPCLQQRKAACSNAYLWWCWRRCLTSCWSFSRAAAAGRRGTPGRWTPAPPTGSSWSSWWASASLSSSCRRPGQSAGSRCPSSSRPVTTMRGCKITMRRRRRRACEHVPVHTRVVFRY